MRGRELWVVNQSHGAGRDASLKEESRPSLAPVCCTVEFQQAANFSVGPSSSRVRRSPRWRSYCREKLSTSWRDSGTSAADEIWMDWSQVRFFGLGVLESRISILISQIAGFNHIGRCSLKIWQKIIQNWGDPWDGGLAAAAANTEDFEDWTATLGSATDQACLMGFKPLFGMIFEYLMMVFLKDVHSTKREYLPCKNGSINQLISTHQYHHVGRRYAYSTPILHHHWTSTSSPVLGTTLRHTCAILDDKTSKCWGSVNPADAWEPSIVCRSGGDVHRPSPWPWRNGAGSRCFRGKNTHPDDSPVLGHDVRGDLDASWQVFHDRKHHQIGSLGIRSKGPDAAAALALSPAHF